MTDYRKEPDYDPIPAAEYCEDCGAAIHEGEEYYMISLMGRTYLKVCPSCMKNWMEECRYTA